VDSTPGPKGIGASNLSGRVNTPVVAVNCSGQDAAIPSKST
jgi:hypothetical protein